MEVVEVSAPVAITPAGVANMPQRQFQKEIKAIESVRVLNAICSKLKDDDEEKMKKKSQATKRKMFLVRRAAEAENPDEFKARIALEPRYSTLTSLAKKMQQIKDKKRLRIVTKRIEELQKSGELKKKVRVEGTGTRVEKTFVYAKTKTNDELGRSGKEYTKLVWEGAEYEEQDRRIRKRRIRDEAAEGEDTTNNKRPKNRWILALEQAKKELNVNGLVIVRREALDRDDEKQVLGERVYKRAREIMEESKNEETN